MGLIHWFSSYKKTILNSLCLSIVLLFFLFQWMGRTKKTHFMNHLEAERIYTQWEGASYEDQGELLSSLQKMMTSYPELQQKFDIRIAQRLLEQRRESEALPYVDRVIARVSPPLLHTEFSRISLDIAHGDFKRALEESKRLRVMIDETEEMMIFQAYNLLRIALLEEEVGTTQGESEALQEILHRNSSPMFREALQSLQNSLDEGGASLFDYIAQRQTKLS
jgi:hypothetical protein